MEILNHPYHCVVLVPVYGFPHRVLPVQLPGQGLIDQVSFPVCGKILREFPATCYLQTKGTDVIKIHRHLVKHNEAVIPFRTVTIGSKTSPRHL